jgi:ketosteroid isomerase-like protein
MTASRIILPQRTPYTNRYAIRITMRDGLIWQLCEYVNPLPAAELTRRLQLV